MYIFILFYCSPQRYILGHCSYTLVFVFFFFFCACENLMFKKKICLGVLAIIITDDRRLFVGS